MCLFFFKPHGLPAILDNYCYITNPSQHLKYEVFIIVMMIGFKFCYFQLGLLLKLLLAGSLSEVWLVKDRHLRGSLVIWLSMEEASLGLFHSNGGIQDNQLTEAKS